MCSWKSMHILRHGDDDSTVSWLIFLFVWIKMKLFPHYVPSYRWLYHWTFQIVANSNSAVFDWAFVLHPLATVRVSLPCRQTLPPVSTTDWYVLFVNNIPLFTYSLTYFDRHTHCSIFSGITFCRWPSSPIATRTSCTPSEDRTMSLITSLFPWQPRHVTTNMADRRPEVRRRAPSFLAPSWTFYTPWSPWSRVLSSSGLHGQRLPSPRQQRSAYSSLIKESGKDD